MIVYGDKGWRSQTRGGRLTLSAPKVKRARLAAILEADSQAIVNTNLRLWAGIPADKIER